MARALLVSTFLVQALASEGGAGSTVRRDELLKRLHELEVLVHSQQALAEAQQTELQQQQVILNRQQAELQHQGTQITRRLDTATTTEQALDHIWILICGTLVMFMQAGFAMLEAGCCRSKNVQHILLKNLSDVCIGTLGWWTFGYAFAFGGAQDNGFIGHSQFFGTGFMDTDGDGNFAVRKSPRDWFFQWAFSSAASTIVSGGVAERVQFPGYVCFSFLMTALIYPVVVAWTWGFGFLASVTVTGYIDFAGSGIVHMTGGVGALVGAAVAGPREGRWERPQEFVPHSMMLIVLGTFILWFGWYGFNCGSTLALHNAERGYMAAQIAMNTTLSAAAGGLTVFILTWVHSRKLQVGSMCNGILAGLVSITAGCGNVECGSAVVIGFMGALFYLGASTAVRHFRVDDPIDAFAIHGFCGAWGVLAAAIFDWGKGLSHAHGWNGFGCIEHADGNCIEGAWAGLFAANVLEMTFIVLWVGAWSLLVFIPLRFAGFLRSSCDLQLKGMDNVKHFPPRAYSIEGGILEKH